MPSLPFGQNREPGPFQVHRIQDDQSAYLQQMEMEKIELEQPE